MKIAILETGRPPRTSPDEFGDYPAMFVRAARAHEFGAETFRCARGRAAGDPDGYDAYLITGSPAGVYEPLPWIDPLSAASSARRDQSKMVGVCFGHQVMAEALGGHVDQVAQGLGNGAAPLFG